MYIHRDINIYNKNNIENIINKYSEEKQRKLYLVL